MEMGILENYGLAGFLLFVLISAAAYVFNAGFKFFKGLMDSKDEIIAEKDKQLASHHDKLVEIVNATTVTCHEVIAIVKESDLKNKSEVINRIDNTVTSIKQDTNNLVARK